MKKNLTLFIILPLLVLISACKKSNDAVVPNQTIITSIRSSDWVLSADGTTYSASVSVPEITSNIIDSDGELVYISVTDGLYEKIPYVYSGISYSYAVSAGYIDLDVQDPILGTTPKRPPNLTIKIVLIPSGF